MTHPIYETDQFPEALELFFSFQPVKVKRELKEAFSEAITAKVIESGDWKMKYGVYPLKKSFKFKRK